jgi:hypothetical protein
MKTETTEVAEVQMIVTLKAKMPAFMSQAQAKKLEAVLLETPPHRFVKLPDGRTVNTTEIEQVLTSAQFDDMQRIQNGERHCQWGNWHGKRETCSCREEANREAKRKWNEITNREENRPSTPEERMAIAPVLNRIRKDLESRGVLKPIKATGYRLKRSALNAYRKQHKSEYQVPAGAIIDEDV